MEKRLLTAIVLSFLVMWLWSALMINPNKAKLPQLSDSTGSEEVLMTDPHEISSIKPQEISTENIIEFTQQTENNKLIADFSNIGGNLKKVIIKEYTHSLPVTNILNIDGYENVSFTLEEHARNFVAYGYQDEDYKIIKKYHMGADNNLITSVIEVTNMSKVSKLTEFSLDNFLVDISRVDKSNSRYKMLLEYSIFYNNLFYRKKNLTKFKEKENKSFNVSGDEHWAGFRDQYFSLIINSKFKINKYTTNVISSKNLKVSLAPEPLRIEPGHKVNFESTIYVGPQDKKALKSFGKNFEKIIDFKAGGFIDIMAFGQTDRIAKIMLMLLNFLHRIIPNWGVAIILFACVIYGITFPLTQKSMSSMKKMQAIQPKILSLKEKHKDNAQKMNKEMAELYKSHKVNPFGGCLPIFLQMPIFISLYQLLWRSYCFKGANFLWIKDLSEPDRLFMLPVSLPYFGNEFNILPIFYALLMVVQQKFQSKNMPVTDSSQADMQKMMGKIFPVMLGMLFYKFASGLTLYFTIYFSLTTFSQWKISRIKKA